jgi:hypothetical protein
LNLVSINMAGPRFLNCVRAQKGKYHGAYSESRRGEGGTCLLFEVFLVELVGFTFLYVQNTTLISALKISILFQLQHSRSKSKRAFPGKFYRRSSHASGRLKVGCG